MTMVGWLVMRPPIIFKNIGVSFSYFHIFIIKGGRLIYSLRVMDGVRSKKNAIESHVFIPISSYQRELSIVSVKDKIA